MKQIRPFINTELVKVLTGIRRSGKSIMLELIKQELMEQGVSSNQFISMNFEQMSNLKFCHALAFHDEIETRMQSKEGKVYFFFDEIQEVEEWEKCINSFRLEYDCDIYITGSNAKLLSGELATYLAGRYVEFIIYPFSFQEFYTACQLNNPQIEKRKAFNDYVDLGGMPFLTNLINNKEACLQYLKDVYNSVVLKDVIARNKIRNVDLLERIILYVLANIGQPFSASAIAKYFKNEKRKVSHETILNYMKVCQDAFLFYRINREDIIGKKILTVNEKYYVADHGLREAVYGQNNRDINLVLENIVCIELLRRGYSVTVGKTGINEVDFIGVKNNDKIYIQVSYLLATPQTVEREFNVYNKIKDNYPKYVLSLDEFDFSRNGIKHYNICDFLLKEDWN